MNTLAEDNTSSTYRIWLAQLDKHQTFKPVMVSVVGSIPPGGNFFFAKTICNFSMEIQAQNVKLISS